MPSVFSAELQTGLSLNMTSIGVIYSAFLYTYVFMQIPAGLVYDRFHSRNILFFAVMILVLGCLLMVVAHSFWMGILARMVMGLGGSFAFIGALYIGRNWFPIVLFPLIVGLTEAMSGVSEITLLPLMAYLGQYQNWRTLLVEFALVLVVLAMMIFIFVKERHIERKKRRKKKSIMEPIVVVVKQPVLWLLSLYVGFTFTFSMVIANMWGIPLLSDYYNIPTWQAAIETGMVMFGFVVGSFCVGFIARYLSNRLLMLWLAGIQFVVMVLFWHFNVGLLTAGVALFIIGFTSSAIVLCFDLVKKIFPEHCYGLASGFLNMFFGGMGIIVSPIVGSVYATTSSDSSAFIPVLCCSFFGVVVALILKGMKIKQLPKRQQGLIESEAAKKSKK